MTKYSRLTISPVRICAAAAATLRGVRRFRRPSWIEFSTSFSRHLSSFREYGTDTVIFAPNPSAFKVSLTFRTHRSRTHAPGGAPGISGSSFLDGNFVESGSNGIVVAVLLNAKTSAILASLTLAFKLLPSDIVYGGVFSRIIKRRNKRNRGAE